MKKIWLVISLVFFSRNLWAQNDNFWARVYSDVRQAYVDDVSIEELAIACLKNIKKIDKNLTFADDKKRISLYYKGKIVEVKSKPQQKNDALNWGKLSQNMIDKAYEKSARAREKDFQNNNILASGMLRILDKDSKYFEDEYEIKDIKNKRSFACRYEEEILYFKILAINKQTYKEIVQALEEQKKYKAIVLDLRNCVGGMAGEAIKITELFLDGGIVASTKSKKLKEEVYYVAKDGDVAKGKQMFVLVDENTASAGEILAMALQEQSRAKIIGTITKGKGTMQKLIKLEAGAVLAVTNGYFYAPSGKEINLKGIVPDICTFEQSENEEPLKIIERKNKKYCHKENRENKELEMKIVKYMVQKQAN